MKLRTPPPLQDQELRLVLHHTSSGNLEKQWAPAYFFHMMHAKTGAYMGRIDLRIGDNENLFYGGHIGYEVEEVYRGNGYAARSVQLLLPFAKKHGFKELCITCNPENIPSQKSCLNAGGVFAGEVVLPEHNNMYQLGERTKYRYLFSLKQ